MDWQRLAAIAAVLAVLGGGTVAFFKYHATFAKAESVQKVSTEFKYYRLSNQAAALQQRMWQLEDRFGCENGNISTMPQSSKEEYRRLEADRKALLLKVKGLEVKGKE